MFLVMPSSLPARVCSRLLRLEATDMPTLQGLGLFSSSKLQPTVCRRKLRPGAVEPHGRDMPPIATKLYDYLSRGMFPPFFGISISSQYWHANGTSPVPPPHARSANIRSSASPPVSFAPRLVVAGDGNDGDDQGNDFDRAWGCLFVPASHSELDGTGGGTPGLLVRESGDTGSATPADGGSKARCGSAGPRKYLIHTVGD